MNPKSGKAGSAVPPAEPKKAMAADLADPGAMAKIKAEERRRKAGKYGETPLKSLKADEDGSDEDRDKKKSWIEIELVDDHKDPVPGEKYRITLPDGETVAEGTLDEKGLARVDGIEPGTCQITFPDLDKDAWKPR
jgi:type VI secretion system secreted protein VgrG